ncbi:glycerophosphodiester phosphodiesterase family protein [Siphonobacter sp.]|uniref:glycerophosphodiester phosphodiesterase family protein n=1 Tax=Siphonobacter sp. TaxID=1869184 RepID=UPI003B3AC621
MRLLFYLLMLLSCVGTAQSFDVQGHRGCRGLEPENTIPAFLKALELGVSTLELDVVLSQDQQVVVSHDWYFNPRLTTKPDGTPLSRTEAKTLRLDQMSYDRIKRYDVGLRGNAAFPEQNPKAAYKPLLSEVIEIVDAYAGQHQLPLPQYSIEIKTNAHTSAEIMCRRVAQLLTIPAERFCIQSFDVAVLQYWKAQQEAGTFPNNTLSLLVIRKGLKRSLEKLGFRPDIFSPEYRFISKRTVRNAHALGIRVIPWTVNERRTMLHLQQLGVDGLITDYPNRFKK